MTTALSLIGNHCVRFCKVIQDMAVSYFRVSDKRLGETTKRHREQVYNRSCDTGYMAEQLGVSTIYNVRQEIIEQFLKPSKCYITARLTRAQTLPTGEVYDHVIASRYILFYASRSEQILSFFFSSGIDRGESLCNFELHCILERNGDVVQIKEYHFTEQDREFIGIPTYYRPTQTDETLMEKAVSFTNSTLELIADAAELIRLPITHRLLKRIRFETKFELER